MFTIFSTYAAPSPTPSYGSTKSYSPGPRRSGSRREIRMHDGHTLPLDELRMAAMQGNLPVVKALLKQGKRSNQETVMRVYKI